jgi:hypothetical protein
MQFTILEIRYTSSSSSLLIFVIFVPRPAESICIVGDVDLTQCAHLAHLGTYQFRSLEVLPRKRQVLSIASMMREKMWRQTLLLITIALASSAAHALHASPHSIACTSSDRVSGCAAALGLHCDFCFPPIMSRLRSFRADFDYSGFQPGSGFFNVVNATIQDNYNGLAKRL